jgi:hypothetical protein
LYEVDPFPVVVVCLPVEELPDAEEPPVLEAEELVVVVEVVPVELVSSEVVPVVTAEYQLEKYIYGNVTCNWPSARTIKKSDCIDIIDIWGCSTVVTNI